VGRGTMVVDPPVSARPDAAEGPPDSDLVAGVRRGDDRAFEQLYSRYQRRISAYVFGMVKDHGRAEDITQEVFISALRRMRETQRPIAFKPWVYEIAKNACIDQFRRSRRAEEVSFDAGEGDQGRLVASEPSPDAAVDAKQQLDHLCGAFGGLSDSHHEILVLREFEGLSYREIGDRMGLSRPGVESTLFRARRRLNEEYDELVSGQRCSRIQTIIASAGQREPGARDSRRLARHVAHCQPCRRQAIASGVAPAVLARRPAGRRVAERVAGLLPIPGFLRSRMWAGSEQIAPVAEPLATGWSKAVAVAATVMVAGVGAGVAPHGGRAQDAARHAAAKPAIVTTGATQTRARPVAARRRPARTRARTTSRAAGHRSAPRTVTHPHVARAARSGSTGATRGTAPTAPAAVSPTGSAPSPPLGVSAPTAGGVDARAPSVPAVKVPAVDPAVPAKQVGSQVTDTVSGAGQAVDQTAQGVSDAASGLPKLGG
jgi:RNA polymerase sigma factor (sigma-70 family)